MHRLNRHHLAFIFAALGAVCALLISQYASKIWVEQSQTIVAQKSESGHYVYRDKGQLLLIENPVDYASSPLSQSALDKQPPPADLASQWVIKTDNSLVLLTPTYHYGALSLLPALLTIILCLLTREPITALLSGIVVGALMLGYFDLTDEVFIPSLAKEGTAGLLLLYLWLLGGLLGVWSKTGAANAFAEYMATHFVKGPRSAKLVSWCLGVLFFQGGTMSTALVGTTIRPLADKAKVSHEEMSYIVDSTASPIACVLAFNAWPAYVQALIFVPGVAFLATETDRINFFFNSIPFSFYGILAVLGTLLLSLNITRFSGKRLRDAKQRADSTGQLDAPGAKPLSAPELQNSAIATGYTPRLFEFTVPLFGLITIAVGTFVYVGTPKVNWAFSFALLSAATIALIRGMSLANVLDGFGNGLKGVVVASVILMFAVTLGSISKELGGGLYLVSLLSEQMPFWLLPFVLQIMTMAIAFSTGTSWGTYAIAFPLAMPLAFGLAEVHNLENILTYMMICFATVLNGAVYGDQCSPISDTTILSAMTTGCDLMDHVKSQLVPATMAASLAALLWLLCTLILV